MGALEAVTIAFRTFTPFNDGAIPVMTHCQFGNPVEFSSEESLVIWDLGWELFLNLSFELENNLYRIMLLITATHLPVL